MPRSSGPVDSPARLSIIARHLAPDYPLNTPYTVERLPNNIDASHLPKTQIRALTTDNSPAKMSNQPEHPTLLIPGPIEFDDAVLNSMSHYR